MLEVPWNRVHSALCHLMLEVPPARGTPFRRNPALEVPAQPESAVPAHRVTASPRARGTGFLKFQGTMVRL
jgi:hypothetical protein